MPESCLARFGFENHILSSIQPAPSHNRSVINTSKKIKQPVYFIFFFFYALFCDVWSKQVNVCLWKLAGMSLSNNDVISTLILHLLLASDWSKTVGSYLWNSIKVSCLYKFQYGMIIMRIFFVWLILYLLLIRPCLHYTGYLSCRHQKHIGYGFHSHWKRRFRIDRFLYRSDAVLLRP